MSEQLLTIFSQFGAAGLIGLMWIVERRSAAARERQLSDAHARLISQNESLDAILKVVKENTQAISRLEQTQRRLIGLTRNHAQRPRKKPRGSVA